MAIVAVVGATALAFATINPPPLKTKARAARPAVSVVAPIAEQVTPPAAPAPADERRPASPVAPARPEAAVATDGTALPLDELRARAAAKDRSAMEELGRRLLQGDGVAKDQQAGAGWILRAAELGSAQSAFNVGVMYERGFVVERDSARAVEWYRKAADANLPVAKHNLALLLRDGKGVARDGKAAVELLLAAARQGMAASMFSLGDIYDRGDAAPQDPVSALAWFAIAAEFERQSHRGTETSLAKTANQRTHLLQGTLGQRDLERAQAMAQAEFRRIVEAITPKPEVPTEEPPPASATSPAETILAAWPTGAVEQIRTTQQFLLDLKLLRDKPDGNLGPLTRAAIRDFQRRGGLKETGEPSRELYLALALARGERDILANSPSPSPPRSDGKPEPPKEETAKADLPKTEPPRPDPPRVEPTRVPTDPPKPPMPTIQTAKPEPVKIVDAAPPSPRIELARADPPPPLTSADVARVAAALDPDAWPASRIEQVRAVQTLLRDLKLYGQTADGQTNAATRAAIRDYERMAGLKSNGEVTRALFESLKEMRGLMVPKPAATGN